MLRVNGRTGSVSVWLPIGCVETNSRQLRGIVAGLVYGRYISVPTKGSMTMLGGECLSHCIDRLWCQGHLETVLFVGFSEGWECKVRLICVAYDSSEV